MDLPNVIMQTVEMKVILPALVQISKFYAITNQTDAICGIVWWRRSLKLLYSLLHQHPLEQCISDILILLPIIVNLEQLLWIYASLL